MKCQQKQSNKLRLKTLIIMDRCVICYCKIRGGGVRTLSSSKDSLLEQQLSVLFLLDNLLKATQIKEKFTTLLKTDGNPSTWISFCYPCSIWVEGGKKIFRDIGQLQKDLDDLRDKVETTIKRSFSEDESSNDNDKKSVCCFVRNAVVQRCYDNDGVQTKLEIEEEEEEFDNEDELMDPLFFDGIEDLVESESGGDGDDNCSIYSDSEKTDSQDPDYQPTTTSTSHHGEGGRTKSDSPPIIHLHLYFDDSDDKMKCKLCGKELSKEADGSTSDRLRHLKSFHQEFVGHSKIDKDVGNDNSCFISSGNNEGTSKCPISNVKSDSSLFKNRGARKRQRKPNWSEEETLALTVAVKDREKIFLVKGHMKRKTAWREVLSAVNAVPGGHKRTLDEVKVKYKAIKHHRNKAVEGKTNEKEGTDLASLSPLLSQNVLSHINTDPSLDTDGPNSVTMIRWSQNAKADSISGDSESNKRHRAPNWSEEEELALETALKEREGIFRGDKVSARIRKGAWKEVVSAVNAVENGTRTLAEVKQKRKRMKLPVTPKTVG